MTEDCGRMEEGVIARVVSDWARNVASNYRWQQASAAGGEDADAIDSWADAIDRWSDAPVLAVDHCSC